MCKHMKISATAYYHWWKTSKIIKQDSPRMILKNKIKQLFIASKEVYGSYRIQKQLERENISYSRSYVAVLMQEMGLRSILKRKFVVTTDSNHSYPISKNLLNRDFSSMKLGEKWVSDITYIRVNNDWNYLTTIIDLADRKVVGWSLSEDMTTENTVYKAWLSARNTREISDGLVFHSDRGVQYCSNLIGSLLGNNIKVSQSMSRKGNCWDNSVSESFFKTIKHECLYRYNFSSYEGLYGCISEYISWYNTQRIHSILGYIKPLEKELELRGLIKNVA